MSEPISETQVSSAMLAFIRCLDPHAWCCDKQCHAEIDGTKIGADLGTRFESIRSVYLSAVEKVERRGFRVTKS